jgi:4-hydroxy-L-threonine phosphate dehydrogenase PdxA
MAKKKTKQAVVSLSAYEQVRRVAFRKHVPMKDIWDALAAKAKEL